MIPLAWLCLLVSPSSVDLVDEVYRIPANEWRYVEVSLRQRPALLSAELTSPSNSPGVRAALLRRDDLIRLRDDRPFGVLASTAPGPLARLHYYIHEPGEYAVVLDNRDGDAAATVRLRVWLDFAGPRGPDAGTLSPERRLAVILISFGAFLAIATWSVRRLLQAVRR